MNNPRSKFVNIRSLQAKSELIQSHFKSSFAVKCLSSALVWGAMLSLIVLAAVLCVWPAAKGGTAPQDQPLHVVTIPYYSTGGNWDSTLTLNNAAHEPLTASITLYSLRGKSLALPDVLIAANDNAKLLLDEAILATQQQHEFREGSLELRFRNKDGMALGPQVVVTNRKKGLSFDLEPPMNLKSSRLEGLWWSLDDKTEGRVMLTNTSTEPVSSTLSIEWKGVAIAVPPIILAAHNTLPVSIGGLLKEAGITTEGIDRGGLSITHDGRPGAIVAQGVIMNKARRFSSNLLFVDPMGQKTSELFGNGLLIGPFIDSTLAPQGTILKPQLFLKNASAHLHDATITVQYMASGTPQKRTANLTDILPHEVRVLDLYKMLGKPGGEPVENASVKILSSGVPGSIIGALSSVDRSKAIVVDVPLTSKPADSPHGGSHPFECNETFSSMAYLTSITDEPTIAMVKVFYEGGEYTPELISIAPGETKVVNIQELRDGQIKDVKGRALPRELERGQIVWIPRKPKAITGRVVMLDTSTGKAANFSCPTCCSATADHYEFNTAPFVGLSGTSQLMDVGRYDRYCGSPSLDGPYNVTSVVSFSSNNPTKVSCSSTGNVSYLSSGVATIFVEEQLFYSDFISAEDCGWFPYDSFGECPATTITAKIKQSSTDITNMTTNVIVGQKTSLTAEVLPATVTTSNRQWSIPGETMADYIASNSQASVTPLSSLSGTSVNYYWVDGGDGRQVTFSFTVEGKSFSAMTTFNVKRPTASITTSEGTIGIITSGNLRLQYGNGVTPGLSFSRSITIPSGFSGTTQWVQLVSTLRRRRLNAGTWQELSAPVDVLDTTYPYSTSNSTNDSPFLLLTSDYSEVSINEVFDMYLMFTPSGADSRPVPLVKRRWQWTALATRSGSTWTLVSSSKLTNAIDVDTTDHPTWIDNITNFTFQ